MGFGIFVIRHFYDAFSLHAEVSIRAAAIEAFQLQEGDLSGDLLVSVDAAVARGWADHQEQPVDQNAPEPDRRNVPDDVISVSASEVDSDSSHGGDSSYETYNYTASSCESSDTEPPASEMSDQQSMLEHAYKAARDAFNVSPGIGGEATLNVMDFSPPHWPLAKIKMTLPLKFGCNG